ncbi:hypothetical protein ACFLZ8_03925, partial [Planctomycetota bacterium]
MAKKNIQDDLQHLPAVVADFIRKIIKKMRYRTKIRRDVLVELSAHFEDELKDCTTGQEEQQKAQQLIAEFGDVKLLSILLRRAKKRCRPLWRTIVARSFQAAGILFLCFVFYIIWFLSGKPTINTNYLAELNNMVRPAADESLNAAPLYAEAVMRYEQLSQDDNDTSGLLSKKPGEITPEEKLLIEKWLSDNEEILDLIVAGSKLPYCWFKYKTGSDTQNEMISVGLPGLNVYRKCAYSLRWRALLRAETGRFDESLNYMKACYHFGKHFKSDITLVEQLVGLAIQSLAANSLRNIISEYEIDSKLLADFQKDFEQIIADQNFLINFNAEKLSGLDEIQRCFTSDGIGKGHIYLPRIKEITTPDLDYEFVSRDGNVIQFIFDSIFMAPYLAHPNKEETLNSLNNLYGYWEQVSLKTPAQIHTEHINVSEESRRIIESNLFLESFTPGLSKVIEFSYRIKIDIEATLTIVALIRYKQDTGQYPENLEQLVTDGYLTQLPIDPFSDEPLAYRQTDDDFLLYSYGINCIDDGGQRAYDRRGNVVIWSDEADAVFWPVQQ